MVTRDGSTVTVWLNRPDKRNAMNLDMWLALEDACHSLKARGRTRRRVHAHAMTAASTALNPYGTAVSLAAVARDRIADAGA